MLGVIELDGRFAVPSLEGGIDEATEGIENLQLIEKMDVTTGSGFISVKGETVGTPKLKLQVGNTTVSNKGKKKRKARMPIVTPGQKLITDMMEKDGNLEPNVKE